MSVADNRRDIKVIDDPAYTEWFTRMQGDVTWFLGQAGLVQRYAGNVVLLYHRQVVGRGEDHVQAKEDARRYFEARGEALPPPSELLFIPLSGSSAPEPAVPLPNGESPEGTLREGA
jgi:hypothetical protein